MNIPREFWILLGFALVLFALFGGISLLALAGVFQ